MGKTTKKTTTILRTFAATLLLAGAVIRPAAANDDWTVSELSLAASHACTVDTDNVVRCWGNNLQGQLGDGSTTVRPTPVVTTGITGTVVALGTGIAHTCALKADGTIQCWGANFTGQIGDGTTTNRSQPTAVTGLPGPAARLFVGGQVSCAVLRTGETYCWGDNSFGQMAIGVPAGHQPLPVRMPNMPSGVIQMAMGNSIICALVPDDGFTVRCWGRDVAGNTTYVPKPVPGLTDVRRIAAGEASACAATGAGEVFCWGSNFNGALGNGTTTNSLAPVKVVNLGGVAKDVAVGVDYACAVLDTGRVRCWGGNANGQLGDNTSSNALTPVDVYQLSGGVRAIRGGDFSVCALTTAGRVKCWGSGGSGTIGDGTTNLRRVPTNVGFVGRYPTMGLGLNHSCARTWGINLRCWGSNTDGQLGDPTLAIEASPRSIPGFPANANQVVSGNAHTCVATLGPSFLNAVCFGNNTSGQLGNGTNTASPTAVAVTGMANNTNQITSGANHVCATTAAGGVRCWGDNSRGQLGDGTTVSRNAPVDVIGLGGTAFEVRAGAAHTCARLSNGTARCWGANESGQLGNNGTTDSLTPISVSTLAGIVSMSAGGNSNCAISVNGTVCWGANESGQLGDGTTFNSTLPVFVTGLPAGLPKQMAVGQQHACALASDGRAYCWGANANGQLGDGTTAPHATAALASGVPAGVEGVYSGAQHSCAVMLNGSVRCWGRNATGQLGIGDATFADHPAPGTIAGFGQVLDFDAPLVVPHPGNFDATPSASSGLAASVANTTLGQCNATGGNGYATVSGGQCVLVASQPGDASYFPASSQTRAVRVLPDAGMQWAQLPNREIDQTPFPLVATVASGQPITFTSLTFNCSVSGTTVTLTSQGRCAIKATAPGDATFMSQVEIRDFNISAALPDQSITFDPLADRELAQTPFTVSATASSGLAVSFSSLTLGTCTVSGTTVSLVATGLCTIRASQAGNASFSPAPDVDRSFTVLADPTQLLTITRTGTNSDVITSAPAGIACPPTCSASFTRNAVVSLDMDITNGRLVAVSGADDSSVTPGATPHVLAHVSMAADRTVGFNFTNPPNQLVSVKGGGGGNVSSSPAGINCGGGLNFSCNFAFAGYADVTLTATPFAGAHFRGFTGGCVSGTNQCAYTVTGFRPQINATFSQAFEVMAFYRLGDDDAGATIGNPAPGITTPQIPSLTGAILSRVGNPQTVAGASGNGKGVLFNGTTDGYEWAGAAQDELDNFIIEAWAKATSSSGNGTVVYVGNPSQSGYGIVRTNGSYRGRIGGVGFVGDFFNGQWGTEQVHLALVRNNGTTRLYINGQDSGASSGAAPNPPASAVNAYTTVGFNSSDFNDFFGGLVDDVRFARFEPGTFNVGQLNLRKLQITSFSPVPGVTVATSPTGFVHPPGTTVRITIGLPAGKRIFGVNPACVVITNTPSQFVCDATLANDFNLNLAIESFATLTVVKNGTGTGRVFTTNTSDIDCGPTCIAGMATGFHVLRATPDAGSTVAAWSEPLCPDPGDPNLCGFNLGADKTITVTFAAKLAQTIAFTSPGDKRLNESVPALVATATSGLPVSFASLTTGVCTVASTAVTLVATGTCTLRASQGGDAAYSAAPDVDVSFQVTPATWIVTAGANGPGRVVSSPAGIDCGSACIATFPVAQQVTLTATPNAGQAFYDWVGACGGQGAVCVLNYVEGDELTIARFGAPFEDIARWRLGEDDGGVPGTPAGATTTGSPGTGLARVGTPQFVAGAQGFGTAVSFNRTNAGYYAGTTISDATDNFGVEAWVKGDGFATGGSMIAYQGHGGTAGYGLLRVDGAVLGLYGGNAVIGDPSEPLLQLGTDWKHVALVRVAGETRMYVNGVLVPSTVSGAGPNPASSNVNSATMIGLSVLSSGVNQTDFFGGVIDAVRYFRFAPTEFNAARLNVRRLKATVNATPDALPVFLTDPPLTLGANNEGVVVPTGSVVRVTIMAPVGARIVSVNPACAVVTQSATQVVCDATVDADLDLTVVAVAERTLTVAKAGTGGGTVSSAPAGIDCGVTCEAAFTVGTLVTLTATPDAASIFTGWSVPACTGTGPCQVVLASSTTVTATFALKAAQTIAFDPLNDRTLAQTPFAVSATASSGLAVSFASTTMAVCTVTGTSVALLTTGTCTIRASQGGNESFLPAPNVDRSFEVTPSEFALTVTLAGNGSGTVTGPGIACPGDCSESFAVHANVMLTASATAGSTFSGWSGACSGTAACFLTMDAARSVTATFTQAAAAKVPGDLDGDGKSDLVFQNADGRIAAWTMNGTAINATANLIGAGAGWSVTHLADLDNDGKADIFFKHTDGRVYVYRMNGLVVTGGKELLGAGLGWSISHAADLNGDGKADLLLRNADGRAHLWLMDGTAIIGSASLLPAGSGWRVVATGDLNGDGRADIVFAHDDGRGYVYLMDGTTIIGGAGFLAPGSGWVVSHVADFNGDGKGDLLFRHVDGSAYLFLMNGTTFGAGVSVLGAGTGWSVTHAGDLNGDGKADLVFRNADGRAHVRLMNGTSIVNAGDILPGATGWRVTQLLDLNGDGRMDLVFRNDDGRITVRLQDGLAIVGSANLIGTGAWEVKP